MNEIKALPQSQYDVAIASPKIVELHRMVPSDHEMVVYNTMAKQAVASKLYRGIGDEAGIMMIMLAARELGIPPMQALNGGVNIIEGKVEISARMMSAMIRRAGHSIKVIESTDDKCTLQGRRSDNGDSLSVSYTIQDAQRAGLIREKGGWKKVPKDMCFARALSRLARQLFSDVVGIGYIEGEISKIEPKYIEETPEVETLELQEIPVDEDKLVAAFLEIFESKEEKIEWLRYLNAVCEKTRWSKEKAINEFSKDMDKTSKKFEIWLKNNPTNV